MSQELSSLKPVFGRMIQAIMPKSIIKDLLIPDKVLNGYTFGSIHQPVGNMRWLENLAKVNVFVGPNNSGKSRLIRELAYGIDSYSFHPYHLTVEQIMELYGIVNKHKEEFKEIKDFCVRNGNGPFPAVVDPPKGDISLSTNDSFLASMYQHIESVKAVVKSKDQLDVSSSSGISLRGHLTRLEKLAASTEGKIKAIISDYGHQDHYHRIYIPVLRGLKALGVGGHADPYWARTKEDYFKTPDELKKDFEIFTGYTMYDQLQKMLSGKGDKRELLKRFEIFLSENFFDEKHVTLIPLIDEKNSNKDVHIKIGDEDEYSIAHLGDGIQQIIIQTFPLFRDADKQLLVFIEEPELFLHPGMQRILLNLFVSLKSHQFFLTTHSNHFLDITLDIDNIAVFNVQKNLAQAEKSSATKPSFHLENVSKGDRSSLRLLGVNNSSVFLTNATIWVEGITDRMYLRNYLKIFQENESKKSQKKGKSFRTFKEDVHFSFVEYGGSCITHWSFVDGVKDPMDIRWLCAESFLLVDRDKAEWKKERSKKMKEKLGGARFAQTLGIEVENMISAKVLRKTIAVTEKIDESVLPSFSNEDYKDVHLGLFIEKNLLRGKATHKYRKSLKSNTINNKLDFCERCVSHTNDISDLSRESIALCKKLYKFISEHNPN